MFFLRSVNKLIKSNAAGVQAAFFYYKEMSSSICGLLVITAFALICYDKKK